MRTSPNNEEDLGIVTVSSRAGRLLFALLLSTGTPDALSLSTMAGVPRKLLPSLIDELIRSIEQSPDPFGPLRLLNAVDAGVSIGIGPAESVTQNHGTKQEPDESVEAACIAADRLEDSLAKMRAQALAVVQAWQLFFPEVNKVQELSPTKAKGWIKLLSQAFPGREATTVFGWLSGVEEKKLLTLDFPLGWVTKMIAGKAEKATGDQGAAGVGSQVTDDWRKYAQNLKETGVPNVSENFERTFSRFTRAVQDSTGQSQ